MVARASQPVHDEASQMEDHSVVLEGATWADYERLLDLRGDRSAPRITYLGGTIEIMSPSMSHEAIKSTIGCLVEVWCTERDIEFSPYGSWTLKKKSAHRGAEPDECYVFGAGRRPRRPDLAIEVEWTWGRIDKLEVYRKLGVREVWYWREGRLEAYVLHGERYRAATSSKVLPGIDLAQLARYIERTPTSAAMRAYRAAIRRRRG
jgi:Uma2 family endonuclease